MKEISRAVHLRCSSDSEEIRRQTMFEDWTNCQVCEYNPTGDKCELFGRVIGMHGCSSGVERKLRNHFEEIKAMSMEEMAAYIDEHTAEAMWCNSPPEECPPEGECVKCILNWLKEEV